MTTTAITALGAGAELSDCLRYRYRLWRAWAPLSESRRVVFVMLNPSTADGNDDDPTIRKCVGFAKRLGAARIDVVNLFALRSTDPRGLLAAEDMAAAVGPNNDEHILNVAGRDSDEALQRDLVVCAWGCSGHTCVRNLVRQRARHVRDLLLNRDLQCLGRARDGSPRHPLMLAYDTPLEPWRLG